MTDAAAVLTRTCHSRPVTYESLSYRFVVHCDDTEIQARAASLLATFASGVDDRDVGEQAQAAVYCIETRRDHTDPVYALMRDGDEVASNPDRYRIIERLIREVSRETVAHSGRDYLLIHAGVAAAPSGAVLLTGESGSGKTTIIAALVQQGYGYLSDEAAVVDLRSPLLQPWPRPLSFKSGAHGLERFSRLLERPDGRGWHVPVNRIRDGAVAAPSPLRWIVDYRYQPEASTALEPLARPHAMALLASATPGLRHHGERGLRTLARLVAGASAYRLRSGDLDEATNCVREMVQRA
jgi:hypothetical protein